MSKECIAQNKILKIMVGNALAVNRSLDLWW